MKRILIFGVSLLLLIALIFGMTFISQFNPDAVKPDDKGDGDQEQYVGQPFLFNSSECRYDPYNTESLQNRMFQGFYEIGEKDTATFWFKNRSPRPVIVTSGASCTTCSAARIAPNELIDEYARGIGISGVIDSLIPFGGPDLMGALAAVHFDSKSSGRRLLSIKPAIDSNPRRIRRKTHVRRDRSASTHRGAHGGRASRASQSTRAWKMSRVPISNSNPRVFSVVGSFTTNTQNHDVGEVAIGVPPKPFDLIAWSATCDFGDRFPPPDVVVAKDDPFVVVGKPQRNDAEEMDRSTNRSKELKGINRVKSAYKYSVKVLREANGKEADIGPFTKEVFIVGLNVATACR
ncbi:MAG: hypothetical protein U0798_16545 [Gemmataceae bacterium]